MPTETNAEQPTFYLDGKPIGRLLDAELKVAEDISPIDGCVWNDAPSMTMTLHLRKLSRKRLVKILMGRGISRNKANAMARTWNGHYAKNHMMYVFTGRIV